MTARARCEHPECERAATQAVQRADMVRAVRCCELHATDFRECAGDGCHRLAQVVVRFGHWVAAGSDHNELWLCAGCGDLFRRAPSLTINGRRLINDGSGRLLPIPRSIARG